MEQQGFLNYVRENYSNEMCLIMKNFMITRKKLASFTSRKMFLIRCRKHGIYPNHITNNIKCLFTNVEQNMPFNNKIRNLMENFKRKILNMEIEMTFWKVSEFNRLISHYRLELTNLHTDPPFILEFYKTQDRIFSKLLNSHITIVNRKFDALIHLQRPFFNFANSNQNACRNISNVDVPNEVIDIVSLGPKFNLPFFDKEDIPAFKILSQSESIIKTIDDEYQRDIARFQICNVFQKFFSKNCHLNMKEKYLKNLTIETKRFLRNNPNIILLNADKGNMSVIMLKSEYEQKINNLVTDANTYKTLNRDPTLTLQNSNNNKIKNLYIHNFIDNDTKSKLTTYTSVIPKFYGLPKIHKINHPLRPIVSFVNSPTYKTSKFLADLLKSAIDDQKYNCKNSYDLTDFIRGQNIPQGYVLISLDVVSLFTNINIALAMVAVSEKWSKISPHTNIPKLEFLDLLDFCLTSGYFSVFNNYYKQINGVAMGSPLSPIIADIVMESLLDTVLNSINFNIIFIKKYVDDLLLCVPNDKVNFVLAKFNNNSYGLDFTLESETDNKLPFLDVMLIRKNDGTIDTVWYAKSLSSGRILNFNSIHPLNQLINTAFGFIYRVKKLTTDSTINTDTIIINYLTRNMYPRHLINKLINRFNQTNNVQTSTNVVNNIAITGPTNDLNSMYKSICFVKDFSSNISNILRKFNINCKITFSATNSIRHIFSQIKDKTPILNQSNTIYLIPCNNCPLKYVGTTKQLLKNRIAQHRSDVKPPIRNAQATTLCQHSFDTGHAFNFSRTKILEREKLYKNRLFLEMLHIIGNHDILVNKKNDTDDLSKVYSGIIDFISKFPKYRTLTHT